MAKKPKEDLVTVTCYRETKTMTRTKAMSFYLLGMVSCDPNSSECARYNKIYTELACGKSTVSDVD